MRDIEAADPKTREEVTMSIVQRLGKPPVRGEGYLIFYLDAKTIPTEAGKPATTAPGTFARVWPNVAAGRHVLGVQLVNNNDTPLAPAVVASVLVRAR